MASTVRASAFSLQRLELGEDLFDRVEIGGVFAQEDQLGAGRADGVADRLAFVAAEIVEDSDIARREGGQEHLLDMDAEQRAASPYVLDFLSR